MDMGLDMGTIREPVRCPGGGKEMHCRLKLLHLQSADINSSTYF